MLLLSFGTKIEHIMINVIASIQIKDGRRSEFIEHFKANVPNVLEEKGCIACAPTVDVLPGLPRQEVNENGVTVIEKWSSLEDLKAHLTAPHMLAFREKVQDLMEGASLRILEDA